MNPHKEMDTVDPSPSSNAVALDGETAPTPPTNPQSSSDSPPRRGLRFWLIFVALSFTMLLAALDLGGVGTAAPTIVHDLQGSDFTWVGSAYALASAAVLPMCGHLANIFGRRPVILGAILIFAVGSAVSGSAQSMNALIVGRAIQGIGGGAVQSLTYIVIADLIPLSERGVFNGIIGVIWTVGSVTGPFIAGGFSENVTWRWLFYMNLPICLVAFILVALLLQLSVPLEDVLTKMRKIDWLGNFLFIASTCSCMIGLTWGGIRYSWASTNVLAPLIIGVVGIAVSLLYEGKWASHPTIPMSVLLNRDSFFGYVATFIHGVVAMSVGYYLPTWFQAVKGASPLMSGTYFLPMMFAISPSAIIQGLIVTKTGRYRLVNFVGWCFILLGMGLFIYMKTDTPVGVMVVFQLVMGVGLGFLYATTFTVLAPLDVSQNAAAISLLTFVRTFSQAWGIAITGTILQDGLRRHLPVSVLDTLPDGIQIAYAIIPRIASMPQPMKMQVQQAFQDSLNLAWIVMEVASAVGLLSFFAMRDLPLQNTTDKKWGISESKRVPNEDTEKV